MKPTSFLFSLPDPPWDGLLGVLLFAFVSLASVEGSAKVNPSEFSHRGDLHLVRGSSVFSLAWVVEVREGCSLSHILGNLRRKPLLGRGDGRKPQVDSVPLRTNHTKSHSGTASDNSASTHTNHAVFCPKGIPAHLVLLKQLEPLGNVYVVAHPYFRTFSQQKRRWIQRRKRNACVSFRDRSATERQPDGCQDLIDSESVFLKVAACMEQYFRAHPCIVYARQEVLRVRQKRRRIVFHDPLFEEQWHLVSLG